MTYLVQIDDEIREATEEEIAYSKAIFEQTEKNKLEQKANAAQKAALLDRLGITEEEAKLLLA